MGISKKRKRDTCALVEPGWHSRSSDDQKETRKKEKDNTYSGV